MSFANMTYAEAMDYRVGLGQVSTQLDPDYMVTLSFNTRKATSFTYGADCIRRFHARLDRYALGPRWLKFPQALRSHGLGFPHGHNCGGRSDPEYLFEFHNHLFLHAPRSPKKTLSYQAMERLTSDFWGDIVPAGRSTHFQAVGEEAGDAFESSYYGSRQMAAPGCPGMQHYCLN